ncbi:hypothetical protein PQR66_37955 [Paraburkholderia agricolaris]|uniref:Uncharacterized protein n=1 Tax=Paraburkholderia agricolaris TaxID=2152888 RepID=A0ABW9A1L0_9BURK
MIDEDFVAILSQALNIVQRQIRACYGDVLDHGIGSSRLTPETNPVLSTKTYQP